LLAARRGTGLAQTADPWYRELQMTRLETLLKPFEKHFSPLNCTSSHFIRKDLACKRFETIFFNKINNLEASLEALLIEKDVIN
jgi:hypothetical protein